VFLAAAAVMLGAFGLSWRLRDVPLRETARSAGTAESVAVPREARAATARTRSAAPSATTIRSPREGAAVLSQTAKPG
jgi:hypothetical protein